MAKTNLEAFDKFLKAINSEVLTPEQFKSAFKAVADVVKKNDAANKKMLTELRDLLNQRLDDVRSTNGQELESLKNTVREAIDALNEREMSLSSAIEARMAAVRDGLDADEELVTERATQRVSESLSPLLTEQEERLLEEMTKLGEQIAEAFERLEELRREADNVGPRIAQAVGAIHVPSPVGWTKHQSISLTSGTTTYSLDDAPAHNGRAAIVHYEGQALAYTTHYTFDGTDITLTFDPTTGTTLDIIYWPF